jgi:hypothetical protein
MIYNLKRFIGDCFDVYFFLWNNGAPLWEREKFLWEQEQLKEWHYVQSKRQKKLSSRSRGRRVHFAPDVSHDPPLHRSDPVKSFVVGSLVVPTTVRFSNVFGRISADLYQSDLTSKACSSGVDTADQISNSKATSESCGKCLAVGHRAVSCLSPWRCRACFGYGHKQRWCLTRVKPKVFWAPKRKCTT